jgi:hypothetical protein
MEKKKKLGIVKLFIRNMDREERKPATRRSTYSYVSATLKDIEDQIFGLERVRVVFRQYDNNRRYINYPFQKALSGNFTIMTLHNRITKFVDDVPYDIIDGYGTRVVMPNMSLSALRATYQSGPRTTNNIRY